MPIDIGTHADALVLAKRYGFSIFDGLMVAAALRAGCGTFWSEDLQGGMVVETKLRIANPFMGRWRRVQKASSPWSRRADQALADATLWIARPMSAE